ncbi:hypothetical protein BDR07DRAFT_401749 [Suillus spraguei]|nr:hypothetical protein BDR07DRAFT_401749 [Suillus spraguei]
MDMERRWDSNQNASGMRVCWNEFWRGSVRCYFRICHCAQGGHQEDAEEFLGFYLDTFEEGLLALSSLPSNPNPAPAQPSNSAATNNTQEDG